MSETRSARDRIFGFPVFPSAVYADVDLNRLTTYTIAALGKADIPSTIENIAVANHRMFPRRFAMVGFPEFPDISRVNRALLQLRPKYRNWATGATRTGWALTRAGVAEADALDKKLHTLASSTSVAEDRSAEPSGVTKRTVHGEDVLSRVRSSDAFKKSQSGWAGIGALEVFDVLDAYSHTPSNVLRRRIRELRTIAADKNDVAVSKFLQQLVETFPTLFKN